MDVRQLRYFLAIAEEEQITRAAQRLHMAQPPLSHQLKLLEQELGVQLVERLGRKLKLTEAGRTLQRRAEQIVGLMEATVSEIVEHESGIRGTLSIGTVATTGSTLLPERIRAFHQRYPMVHFQLWEGNTHQITQLLERRTIEVGIVRLPIDDTKLYDMIRLPTEPLVAAVSHNWNQGESDSPIRLSDLADLPLMLLRRQQGTSIYEQTVEACQLAGFEPRVLCESADIMTLLTLAEAGVGITIVPKSAVSLRTSTRLRFREIVEPSLESTAAVIWLRYRVLSTPARRFIETISPTSTEL
ncbi:LysR family transcriptional regulator [Alicyclobacillus fastidiosus]|uniref:LysR family transcriptional regulator n=1 Tax=Alicyclobacillus fastidiosus TaxID=392011 RepID=A0ABY6ZDI2_9BACL|nr:LysR family transcriptional regulator [Alicyclobacillus fastidiosus]WAH40244.1 LysR family transcriptional regulator [Alicyclobacillus fastidiosus]GMA61610.1 LysR family transcriptional regulator [Alicyclobacillus fastidiosus]